MNDEAPIDGVAERKQYPDPTPKMLDGDPMFDAIWDAIKEWDISRYRDDRTYSGATGNDVAHIYHAISDALDLAYARLARDKRWFK